MFPGYRGMYSYPSTQYHQPIWEPARLQPKEDRADPGFMYGPWAHNCGHTFQWQFPNYCNQGQVPPYYNYRPPCPHFPSPSVYPQPCPVSYIPPPYHTMEIPRYEYDKSVPREFHCYGCANHPCHLKEGNNAKIEEHKPDAETHAEMKKNNFPYPILWIPPGYMMNKEQSREPIDKRVDTKQVSPYVNEPQWRVSVEKSPFETEAEEGQVSPHVKKSQQSTGNVEQDPNVGYGWFPLDIDDIRKLMEGGDGRKTHGHERKNGDGKNTVDVENKDQKKQFPYNIIWVPYNGRGDDQVKHQDQTSGSPATSKVVPTKSEHPDIEAEKMRTSVDDHVSGAGKAIAKAGNLRTIPVKYLEESDPKVSKKDGKHKGDVTLVKDVEVIANHESAHGSNVQSSSPTKKSKLPPICLRVDPPKKKNGNGSLRSPSPPHGAKREYPDDSKAGRKIEEAKVTECVGKKPSQDKIEEKKGSTIVEEMITAGGKSGVARSGDDLEVRTQEPQGEKENMSQEVSKPDKKVLSETESAVIIQSAYRGYGVRRLEPLKKLRQIAMVHEEAGKVKKQIEDLESRPRCSIDYREKAAVRETIMKLLLELDTIQGLHPSVRGIRRCVAKELIVLQEKLDSITSHKSAATAEETATLETIEEAAKLADVNEGSNDNAETCEESSNQNEDPQAVEEVHIIEECSQEAAVTAKALEEEKVAPSLNEVLSCQPPTNEDIANGSVSEDALKTFPVGVEAYSGPQEKGTDSSPVPKVVDSCTDDGSEIVPRELSAESQEASDNLEGTEDSAMQMNMASWNKDEAENLLVKPSRDIVEGNGKIQDMEDGMGSSLRDDPLEDAVELSLLAELPQEVIKEDVKKPTSEVSSSEALNRDHEMEHSCEEYESKGELPCEFQGNQGSEGADITIDMDMPNVENNDEHLLQDPVDEEAVPTEAGSVVGKLEEVPMKSNGDTTRSLQMGDVDLDSTPAFLENPNEDVCRLGGAYKEKTQVENEPPQDEDILCENDNTSSSETVEQKVDEAKASQFEAQQFKDEDEASKPCKESQGLVMESEIAQQFRDEDEASKPCKESQGLVMESEIDKKILEENEKLREMVEKLVASGKEQQNLIYNLSGKLKDLEKKLARKKKKMKTTKRPRVIVSRPLCGTSFNVNGLLREKHMGVAS